MAKATALLMVLSNKHSVLVDILRKTITLQFKSRKLHLTVITILSLLLNSLLLFTTIFSTKSVFRHLGVYVAFHRSIAKENVGNMMLSIINVNEEILLLLGAKSYLSIASFAILVLEMVLETTKIHSRWKISLSSICITFSCSAVICLVWAHFVGIVADAFLMAHDPYGLLNFTLGIFLALGVFMPLVIHLVFTLVVWVNHGGCGFEKAEEIVLGTRLYACFAWSFSIALPRVIFVHCLIGSKESNKPGDLYLGFVWTVISCGMTLLEHLGYILEYHQGKKMSILEYHQSKKMSDDYYVTLEEGGLEYSKISTTPFLSQDST